MTSGEYKYLIVEILINIIAPYYRVWGEWLATVLQFHKNIPDNKDGAVSNTIYESKILESLHNEWVWRQCNVCH